MNFLGVDTSSEYLTVIACKDGKCETRFSSDCLRSHSVRLMDEIDSALSALSMKPSDCDFFAAVVGAGSFTGIRIGISCVKGLCLATQKPALPVTSFDVLAYAVNEEKLLACIDAGHGYVYAAGYSGRELTIPPAYISVQKAEELSGAGYCMIDRKSADPVKGFWEAIRAKYKNTVKAEELTALYLRKSSAEENLKKQEPK